LVEEELPLDLLEERLKELFDLLGVLDLNFPKPFISFILIS